MYMGDLGKTSAAKAQAKLVKLANKEAKHDQKIAAKLAKYGEGSAKAAKVLAKEAKHDSKYGAKVTKLTNIVNAAAGAPVLPAPTVPAIVTPPSPVETSSGTVSPMPTIAPPAFSVAPPPAAESFAAPIAQAPSLFTPAPSATPDSSAPAPAESDSKTPLILGGLAVAAAFFLFKKKRG